MEFTAAATGNRIATATLLARSAQGPDSGSSDAAESQAASWRVGEIEVRPRAARHDAGARAANTAAAFKEQHAQANGRGVSAACVSPAFATAILSFFGRAAVELDQSATGSAHKKARLRGCTETGQANSIACSRHFSGRHHQQERSPSLLIRHRCERRNRAIALDVSASAVPPVWFFVLISTVL